MPIRAGMAAFRPSWSPPHLEPQPSQSENCWDSSVQSSEDSVQSSEDVFYLQSSFSLSASAIAFKG